LTINTLFARCTTRSGPFLSIVLDVLVAMTIELRSMMSRARQPLLSLVVAAIATLALGGNGRARELAYVVAREANAVSVIDAGSGMLPSTISFATDELSDLRDLVVARDVWLRNAPPSEVETDALESHLRRGTRDR
jgi:hypothetical protein